MIYDQNKLLEKSKEEKMIHLLLVVGLVLFVLWLLGLITSYTLGGGIHVLLVIAVISMIAWFVLGRV
jgi:preprotein translocase subunit SecY